MSLNVDNDNMFNVEYLNLKKNNSELKLYDLRVWPKKFYLEWMKLYLFKLQL